MDSGSPIKLGTSIGARVSALAFGGAFALPVAFVRPIAVGVVVSSVWMKVFEVGHEVSDGSRSSEFQAPHVTWVAICSCFCCFFWFCAPFGVSVLQYFFADDVICCDVSLQSALVMLDSSGLTLATETAWSTNNDGGRIESNTTMLT